jgi:hypothetical protein
VPGLSTFSGWSYLEIAYFTVSIMMRSWDAYKKGDFFQGPRARTFVPPLILQMGWVCAIGD